MRTLTAGILAGLAAGAVTAALISLPYSLALHFGISGGLGALFGLLLGGRLRTAGGAVVWGAGFGIAWWLVGPLTVAPRLSGGAADWSLAAAQNAFPMLFGYIAAFGAVLGLVYYLLIQLSSARAPDPPAGPAVRPDAFMPPRRQAIIFGAFGGVLGSWVFLRGIETAEFFPFVAALVGSDAMMVGGMLHFLIGIVIGIGFGLLFYREVAGVGPGVIWGMTYGIFWWILGPLTLSGWLQGNGLQPDWSLEAAQNAYPALIAHMLYGSMVGLFYGLANKFWRALFIDSDPINRTREGLGVQGLRGLLMGQAGGIVGGLLFTIVMVGIDALPSVANLVGARSALAGFLVHLLIALTIGSTFGLLFHRQVENYGPALAWGLTYGLLWWLIGTNTLFNVILRAPVDWSLAAAVSRYPALLGHLLYGAGLGLFYEYLTRRFEGRLQIEPLGVAGGVQRRSLLSSPAPALWWVALFMALLLPILLGGGASGSGY
jgi:hypothetical protein